MVAGSIPAGPTDWPVLLRLIPDLLYSVDSRHVSKADALHLGPVLFPRLLEEVLKELSKVGQGYDAVMGVIKDGLAVTEVAKPASLRHGAKTYTRPENAA